MPDPELVCEVRTGGGIYRDWMSVVVSHSFEKNWERAFRLITAEPSVVQSFRLKPDKNEPVDIYLAGQPVIVQGYIVSRQAAFDANRRAVQVDGASKASLITRVSAESGSGQFRGYTIDAIANSVLKPLGLKFRLENPPEGAKIPFPNVMIRWGESPFDLIARLCTQRALWLHADPDGTLVAGAKQGGGTTRLEEGVNILSATARINMTEVEEVIASSQAPGSDSLSGRKVSEVQASATVPGGIKGASRKILAEMPLGQKEVQMRTNMEAQALEVSQLQFSVTHHGWLKPGSGELWQLTDTVVVKSPLLVPTKSAEIELSVFGWTCSQDAQGGSTTTVELVNRAAFGQKFRNALEPDDFYRQSASPAVPSPS